MTLLIIYLCIAIGVSFLCSVLEAVLLSITPSYVEAKLKKSPRQGKVIQKVKGNLDDSISCILILNTFAHTMGAAGVGSQAVQLFGVEWESLIAVLLTLAILYLSEIIPKTLGATYWQQLAGPAARTIHLLVKLVYPLVWLSRFITQFISSKQPSVITREEIRAFAALGFKWGVIGKQENQLMLNLLSLRETSVEEILTPRTVVQAMPENRSVSEAIDDKKLAKFSRIPIFSEDIDHITGVVNRRELLELERSGHGEALASQYAQPIFQVSQHLPVMHLLELFLNRQEHIFVVHDEFGQTAGIVTLEDAIETLLGQEIVDETDVHADMQKLAKFRFRSRLKRKQNLIQSGED